MESKFIQLKFRAENKDIFEAIYDGAKKIETRAATEKFRSIKSGDTVILVCGRSKVEKNREANGDVQFNRIAIEKK